MLHWGEPELVKATAISDRLWKRTPAMASIRARSWVVTRLLVHKLSSLRPLVTLLVSPSLSVIALPIHVQCYGGRIGE